MLALAGVDPLPRVMRELAILPGAARRARNRPHAYFGKGDPARSRDEGLAVSGSSASREREASPTRKAFHHVVWSECPADGVSANHVSAGVRWRPPLFA